MIRPLVYCIVSGHFETSIDTIDQRILELLELRKQYCQKAHDLQLDKGIKDQYPSFDILTTSIKQNALESSDEHK